MHELSRFIVEELTQALGLERDTFTRLESPNSNCTGRMNHYPVCTDPDAVLGIPPHSDTQMLGILYQNDVGGLQVLKDGEWVGIRPDHSTFVVNIGDCFQVIKRSTIDYLIIHEHELYDTKFIGLRHCMRDCMSAMIVTIIMWLNLTRPSRMGSCSARRIERW